MSELKPCPKCKGKPKPRLVGDKKELCVFFCSVCGYTPVRSYEGRFSTWGAEKVWNRRVGEGEKG